MTFDRILEAVRRGHFAKVLVDDGRTDFQKAADIHALMIETAAPSGPKPERKARTIKPKPETPAANGLHLDDHQA
jgi:hypothetical protein